MRWDSLFEDIEYDVLSSFLPLELFDVTSSSLECTDKSAFVCIKGVRDGADYLSDAYERGCRTFVIDRKSCISRLEQICPKCFEKLCIVMVSDSRKTYSLMCRNLFNRPDEGMSIIGITGTKGKTTIAGLIRQMSVASGSECGTIGTLGAYWRDNEVHYDKTTPDPKLLYEILARMKNDNVKLVAMEVSSQALKQRRTFGISFSVGIFTNLYPDHISDIEHKDISEYFYWKTTLFEQCRSAIIPEPSSSVYAESLYHKLSGRIPVFLINQEFDNNSVLSESCPVVIKEKPELITLEGIPSQKLILEVLDHEPICFVLKMPGSFYVNNLIFAAASLYALGVSVPNNLNISPVCGRMECVCVSDGVCFFVDYAHNKAALLEALTSLRRFKPKRLICVFGCGGNRCALRRYGMGKVSQALSDISIITEDNSRFESFEAISSDILAGMDEEAKTTEVIQDRELAIKHAVKISKPGDFVIVAGKGHENYMEKNGKVTYFSDKEVINKYVKICKHNN